MKENICVCFYCVSIFSPQFISNWIEDDNDLTSICLYCGIDSIIPKHYSYELNKELLQKMREYFF